MNRTDVPGTLREMWETRPARPRHDRQVGGVASAVARRYDIDPVLVRIGFVVAALTGIGAVLYLAGWALLPEEPADPADPTRARSPRGILMVGLVVAALGGVGSFFGGDGGWLLPTAVVAVLLFLLHRSRGDRVRHLGVPLGSTGPAPTPPSGPSLVKTSDADGPTAYTALTPPAWDPLGAAPFAWDLPEPGPAVTTPATRRSPVTPVTLGLALLAGGVTAVIMLVAGALTLANVPVLLGVVLAVLGCGLLVGAVVRSGRGLIPVALLMVALTWGVLEAPLERWRDDGLGELSVAPTTTAALLPTYARTAGEIDLDLSDLDLSVVPGGDTGPVDTSVTLGAGEVRIELPEDADLRLTASAGFGEVSFEDGENGERTDSGPNARIVVTDDLGADGVRSGRLLVLDVENGAGDVLVRRG